MRAERFAITERRHLAIANRKSKVENRFARVAKLADAPDLGSGGEILRGSNPLPGTQATKETPNAQLATQTTRVKHWAFDVGRQALNSRIKSCATLIYANEVQFPTTVFRQETRSYFVPAQHLREVGRNVRHCRHLAQRNPQ
jgi:hypothetical protein